MHRNRWQRQTYVERIHCNCERRVIPSHLLLVVSLVTRPLVSCSDADDAQHDHEDEETDAHDDYDGNRVTYSDGRQTGAHCKCCNRFQELHSLSQIFTTTVLSDYKCVTILTSGGSAERVAGVDETSALQKAGGAFDSGIFELDLMVADLCVRCRRALDHDVVVLVDHWLLRRLWRLLLWLNLRVNHRQSLYVVIAGEASVQFRTGQLKGTIQIIGRLSVEVNQLSQYLLIVVNRVRACDAQQNKSGTVSLWSRQR